MNKYKVKAGHMNDQFFVTTEASKQVIAAKDYHIVQVFYNRRKAEFWAAEANDRKSYREH